LPQRLLFALKTPCFSRDQKGKLSALTCPFCFTFPDETKKTTRFTGSRLPHDFVPQHNNDYACVTKSLQLRVSLRFAAPRYDAYCKIWDKGKSDFTTPGKPG
jgi:hypothetical protein